METEKKEDGCKVMMIVVLSVAAIWGVLCLLALYHIAEEICAFHSCWEHVNYVRCQ
jgi:hypothetical protein